MRMVGWDGEAEARGDEGKPVGGGPEEGKEYTTPGRMADGGLSGADLNGRKAPAWLGECGCVAPLLLTALAWYGCWAVDTCAGSMR